MYFLLQHEFVDERQNLLKMEIDLSIWSEAPEPVNERNKEQFLKSQSL